MKKAIIVAVAGVILAIAAPGFAQGPFADVPVDHWAYEAVSQLQDHGIVIGYPDGTFGGKRAMTRYEFALALSRAMPVIVQMANGGGTTPAAGLSKDEIQAMIDASKTPAASGFASQSDVDALKKSINEFRDELSGLGVDLDALKRDVASLEERVAALEAAAKRFKVETKLSFFALGETQSDGNAVSALDKDGRILAADNNLLKDITMVRDADVILNYEAGAAKAKIVLNAGNYLSYLTGAAGGYPGPGLTQFAGGVRTGTDNLDSVNLFLGYGEVPILGADVTVGRFPIQFTKWTLKKFDVDSYSENWKTDDGNYYVDGGKAAWTWGSIDLLAFAGKNNGNAGAYNLASTDSLSLAETNGGILKATQLHGVGNLTLGTSALQSAGVRAAFGVGPFKAGLNYINVGPATGTVYDQVQIFGGDLGWNWGSWKWSAAYTKTDSDPATGSGALKVNKKNAAWEVQTAGTWNRFDINAGYKRIEPNFAAPGDWGKIGAWQNPINIKGPEVGLKFAVNSKWSISGSGGWYDGVVDTTGGAGTSPVIGTGGTAITLRNPIEGQAKIRQYKAGIAWQTSPKSSIGLDGEWVTWDPSVAGLSAKPKEKYYTVSYSHLLTDNTKLKLLYQVIDYKADGATAANAPYGTSNYKGDVAVAQVSMDF